jgi:TPR repeat protein
MARQLGNAPLLKGPMGFKSWLQAKLGMAEYRAENAARLSKWEYAQGNDWDLLAADPFKDAVKASATLVDTSPEEGFAQLLDLANRGSLFGMNYVAWCYASGTGVTKDLDQAQAWYRRAYEGGSDRGLLDYGGYLVSTDRSDEAEKVYEAGWARGFAPAVYRLARIRLKAKLPLAKRLAWKPSLEWAAAAGHPAARFVLSKYLLRGWFGVRGVPRGVKLVWAHFAAIFRDDEDRPIPDPRFR